jgi:hypothetical protein
MIFIFSSAPGHDKNIGYSIIYFILETIKTHYSIIKFSIPNFSWFYNCLKYTVNLFKKSFCWSCFKILNFSSKQMLSRDPDMRFSTSGFLNQTTPPRPLIHGLKPFWIWLQIRGENRQRWLHSGVNDIANDPKHCFYAEIWLGCTHQSGVIDTAVNKIGDFVVDFLREFEAIFKKGLAHVSGARGSCLLKKNQGNLTDSKQKLLKKLVIFRVSKLL